MFIKKFSEISKSDVKEVGGKGASLGEMTQAGFPVPPGFVVITEAYKQFADSEIPDEVEKEILQALDQLGVDRVAVRSSAAAEDSTSSSWAGQLESYLNVTRENLIENIKLCWESIKSERALSYAGEQGTEEDDLVVAVVVQKMVEAEAAGVMFTKNPITKDENQVMIEACWGLGELLVQGEITPDNYIINIQTQEIEGREFGTQEKMLVFRDGKNAEVSVPEDKISEYVLDDEQLQKIAEIGKKIEAHYKAPQDIEFAIEDGQIFIVQSRPITT